MKKIIKGVNDLLTVHPEVAIEWNYELNGDVSPSDVGYGSEKKFFFTCSKGHTYSASLYSRSAGQGCPFCANKRVLKGFNDLASRFPKIAAEWDYEKNDKRPDEVLCTSHDKAWFLCEKGHSYQTQIYSRTSMGTGCPVCFKERKTSFPEQTIFFYVKQHFADAVSGNKNTIGMELDIYIPSIKTAIEYDGSAWHKKEKTVKNEVLKNQLCQKNGIRLIRVREKGLPLYSGCICLLREDNKISSLDEVIKQIMSLLEVKNFKFDIEEDNAKILSSYIFNEKEKSLAVVAPEIAKEWNYEKNGKLRPDHVTAYSSKKAWFTCPNGHEYQSIISNRVQNNQGCPFCASKKVLKGFNDLESLFPEIAAEWDYEKNGDLKPRDVMAYSHRKVWFKCSHGHSYFARISNRTSLNRGCPECDSLLKRPVIVCIENGKIYKNSSEAGEDLGFHDSEGYVSACAKGKRREAYGYHWRLAIEEEKASIGLGSFAPKKISFDSDRADAQNRMVIDKLSQGLSETAILQGSNLERIIA